MDVLLVAAKQDKINDYTSVVSQAGRNPLVVDVDVFALQNCYEMNYDTDPGVARALVNIGASTTNVAILKGTTSIFWRDISVGGNHYNDAIRKELNLSFEQAESLKRGEEVDGIPVENVNPIIASVNDFIGAEIQKTIDFFKNTTPRFEGVGTLGQNVLMTGVVILALLFIGWRWYSLETESRRLRNEIAKAQVEKERLQAIIKKGEEYKAKKELLERKIALITQLKRNQSGPVHLLDEVSKQLPDFLWLDSMTESGFAIQIQGKATTYNAVSNFYNNLTGSPYFQGVVLGPISSIPAGVTFSLTCQFLPHPEGQAEGSGAAPPAGG